MNFSGSATSSSPTNSKIVATVSRKLNACAKSNSSCPTSPSSNSSARRPAIGATVRSTLRFANTERSGLRRRS